MFSGIQGSPERAPQLAGYTYSEDSGYTSETSNVTPITVFKGYQPHQFAVTLPGAVSYPVDPSPVTVAQFNMARGIHDVQLSNGWQRTNYGHRTTYASSGYLAEIVPQIPGQARLIGQSGMPAAFAPQPGIDPSGWQNLVNQAQNTSVNTQGGTRQIAGTLRTGTGSGGG